MNSIYLMYKQQQLKSMGTTVSVNPISNVNEVNVQLVMDNLLTDFSMDANFHNQLQMISTYLKTHYPYKNPEIHAQSILPPLLKLFYHCQFQALIHKLLNLINEKQEQIRGTMIMLQSQKQWEILANMKNFVVLCVNTRVRKFYQSLSEAKDLDEESKIVVNNFLKQNHRQILSPLQSYPNKRSLFESLTQTIIKLIGDLNGILGSKTSYAILKSHLKASFILYLELFYAQDEEVISFIKQSRKDHIIIGTYMLALSINGRKSVLYESSVLFLGSILQNQSHQEIFPIKALYLKNLPIVPCEDIYQQILYLGFFALSKRNSEKFIWRSFRTIRMLEVLLRLATIPEDPKLFYFLEEACKRTDSLQIERVFMHQLIAEVIKHTEMKTDILSKFIRIGDGQFDLRTSKGRKHYGSQFIYKQYIEFMGSSNFQFTYLSESYVFTTICSQNDPNYKDNYKQWSLFINSMQDKKKKQSDKYSVQEEK